MQILEESSLSVILISFTALRLRTIHPQKNVFFQLEGQNLSNASDPKFLFNNNSADSAGTVLYGGTIDNCTVSGLDSYNSSEVFDMLFQYEADNTTSSVSSDPFVYASVKTTIQTAAKRMKTLLVYTSETVQVSVVTVGQRDGIVPAQVRSRVGRGTELLNSQYIQQTNKMCTTLNYTVFSKQMSVTARVICRWLMFNIRR